MKVFGIGLSKTGTKTLGVCLEKLGFRHFSWNTAFAEQVLRGDLEEAHRVAEAYDSFDDLPWPSLYKEMDARYPDAKFVLTVRESPEVWHHSLVRHAEYLGPTEVRERFYGHRMPHGHRQEDIALYERYNAGVLEHFKDRPEKLLTICWKEEKDWSRLCRFLGLTPLDEPLPHANKRRQRSLKQYLRRLRYGSLEVLRQLRST